MEHTNPALHEYIDFGDNLDDIERYIRQYGIPANRFSDEIKGYTETAFLDVNAAIRMGTPDPRIEKLSQQMTIQHHDLISYRSEFHVFDRDVGHIFSNKTFTSTSLHKGVAAEHGYQRRKPYPIGTFLIVCVPKSAKSLLLHTFEYELLLDKGTRLKVLDKEVDSKVRLSQISQLDGLDINSEMVYRAERIYLLEVIL